MMIVLSCCKILTLKTAKVIDQMYFITKVFIKFASWERQKGINSVRLYYSAL